jgi:hypothetical protein
LKVEVRPLSAAELTKLGGGTTFPVLAYGVFVTPPRKRKPICTATCGLAWHIGMCIMWLTVLEPDIAPATAIVRQGRRMLKVAVQMGESVVFNIRDDVPTSAKLLSMVGFERSGDITMTMIDGAERTQELWEWRNSRQ